MQGLTMSLTKLSMLSLSTWLAFVNMWLQQLGLCATMHLCASKYQYFHIIVSSYSEYPCLTAQLQCLIYWQTLRYAAGWRYTLDAFGRSNDYVVRFMLIRLMIMSYASTCCVWQQYCLHLHVYWFRKAGAWVLLLHFAHTLPHIYTDILVDMII